MRIIFASALFLGALNGVCNADEQMQPLAISGPWMAIAHSVSMTAPADVCILGNMTAGVAFRASDGDVELRVMNNAWSLPTGIKGSIQINIGQFTKTFDVGDNTDNMVDAGLESDDVLTLFSAMDKASSMTVIVGKSKPIIASLSGSTKATNAFRTCAHLNSNAPSSGSNPFTSP